MKHTICSILLVGVAGFLSSCASAPSQATTRVEMKAESKPSKSEAGKATSSGSVEAQLWNQVNSYRASMGLQPLKRHAGLDSLARQHCNYLVQHRGQFSVHGKNVSHMGFEGRYAIAKTKYNMSTISENVIFGDKLEGNTATALLNGWKSSSTHNSNMRQKWELSGLAVVKASDGAYYATQIFAVPGSNQSRWAGPQF